MDENIYSEKTARIKREDSMYNNKMTLFVAFLALVAGFLVGMVIQRPQFGKQFSCPPCKCRCVRASPCKATKEELPKAAAKAKPAEAKKPTTKLEKEAAVLYLKWLQRCKKKHAKPYSLHACMLWQQLKKRYLKHTLADKHQIPRLLKALLVLDQIGKDVCEGEGKYNKYQVTKLKNNVTTLIGMVNDKLVNIKRRVKSVVIPPHRMCVYRDGKTVWDYPLK
jgi:hypothetical protein